MIAAQIKAKLTMIDALSGAIRHSIDGVEKNLSSSTNYIYAENASALIEELLKSARDLSELYLYAVYDGGDDGSGQLAHPSNNSKGAIERTDANADD